MMEIETQKDVNMVLFVCSPSLGILDSWISVLKHLKEKLPEAQFAFVAPRSRTIDEIKLKTVLFEVSNDIFDLVIFKSKTDDWVFADNFHDAKKINNKLIIKILSLSVRVFNKLRLDKISRVMLGVSNLLCSKQLFDFDLIDNKRYVTLFDIYELDKPYNKELYEVISKRSNFSIMHGINVNGIGENQHRKALKIENSTIYAYSHKEVEFYKNVYGVSDKQLKVLGIPRHEKKWIDFLTDKESINTERDLHPQKDNYIFVISRPVSEYVPADRKRKYLGYIKKIADNYSLEVVIKLHPKEKESILFEEVFGKDNYGKRWVFSTLHAFALGKNCAFAVSFYSGVPIDLITLGVPTIELLDLKGIKNYDNSSSLRDEKDEPVLSYRYLSLVLGASSYKEFEYYVNEVLNNKDYIVEKLKKSYSDNFQLIENVNQVIASDIIETAEAD